MCRRLVVRAFRSRLLKSPFRTLNAEVHLTDRSRDGLLRLGWVIERVTR